MALRTSNTNGKIEISEHAIAMIVYNAASECYGVVELSPIKFTDSILELFRRPSLSKGVKIEILKNKINIDVYVVLMAGINQEAVEKSLKDAIVYNVERFANMTINSVNVHITGVEVKKKK